MALIGGAVVRWITVLGYPGVLWFTGDSYFYLGRALRPEPSPSKTLGYSYLLKLLEPAHSLTLVAVLQHLMGLAVAVMVYALLRRAGLPGWAATLCALPILYDAYQIELEHLLMSEALFTFLIAAALTLLLWRALPPRRAAGEDAPPTPDGEKETAKAEAAEAGARAKRGRGGRNPAWWMALAAGGLLGYAVLVRSAGAPLIPLVLLCLLMRRRGWRPALFFGTAAAAPLIAYAVMFHGTFGTYSLTTSDGLYLWGRTAPFADCAKMRPPSHMEALCLSPELRAKGYAPGHLIWRSEVPPRVLYENVTAPEHNSTMRDFAIRAILAQPGDYLRTVGDGLGKAFSPSRFPHPTATTEGLYHFPERPQLFPGGKGWGGGANSTALSDAARYEGDLTLSRVVPPHADRMIAYQRSVYLPGPALGVLFLAGAAATVLARDRRGGLLAWSAAVTLLVFPIASADFDYRYVVPAMPFACLAAGLAVTRPFTRSPASGPRTGRPVRTDGEDRADEADGAGDAPEISRWWGSRGSRRRGSDRASVP
ncbi:hypothetical protein [Actinomadura rugatobispora]|uniref:Phospholipid carrier-dependent glycosyltransferase n=1 Tax=Actinomadura rugatobispora TaxID=1994 RepID=A0ABW1AFQ3_9ACTN